MTTSKKTKDAPSPVSNGQMTCGIMVSKTKVCGAEAVDAFNIAAQDGVHIAAVILLCPKHSKLLDDGKALLGQNSDGTLWQIQLQTEE